MVLRTISSIKMKWSVQFQSSNTLSSSATSGYQIWRKIPIPFPPGNSYVPSLLQAPSDGTSDLLHMHAKELISLSYYKPPRPMFAESYLLRSSTETRHGTPLHKVVDHLCLMNKHHLLPRIHCSLWELGASQSPNQQIRRVGPWRLTLGPPGEPG